MSKSGEYDEEFPMMPASVPLGNLPPNVSEVKKTTKDKKPKAKKPKDESVTKDDDATSGTSKEDKIKNDRDYVVAMFQGLLSGNCTQEALLEAITKADAMHINAHNYLEDVEIEMRDVCEKYNTHLKLANDMETWTEAAIKSVNGRAMSAKDTQDAVDQATLMTKEKLIDMIHNMKM